MCKSLHLLRSHNFPSLQIFNLSSFPADYDAWDTGRGLFSSSAFEVITGYIFSPIKLPTFSILGWVLFKIFLACAATLLVLKDACFSPFSRLPLTLWLFFWAILIPGFCNLACYNTSFISMLLLGLNLVINCWGVPTKFFISSLKLLILFIK